MDDLISRKAAIEALGERPYNWTDSEAEIAEVCAWESHKSAIENINAVDAAPVVRCRDCVYGCLSKNARDEDKVFCENPDFERMDYLVNEPDWYCADGERREIDGEDA